MPELLAALDPSSHDQDDVLNAVRVHGLAWTLTILVGSKSQADQLILSPFITALYICGLNTISESLGMSLVGSPLNIPLIVEPLSVHPLPVMPCVGSSTTIWEL